MACDSYTVLMLHCDGTDGSTSFPDASNSPKTVTANGNAQVDTAQFKFPTGSYLGDGVGDYLSVPDSVDFDFPADFTIDFWLRFNTVASVSLVDKQYTSANGYLLEATATALVLFNSGGIVMTAAWTPSTNTWYHVALVRSGTTMQMYIDGSQIGVNTTITTDFSGTTNALAIGADLTDGGLLSLDGWIDEFRISKGIARWTSNFTPPTEPYCGGGGFISRLALLGVG